MPTLEQFQGCLLGLALGDAFGAPYEGGPIERFAWRMIGRTRDGKRRWTDDTQMTIDLAESWLANRGINQDDIACRFADSYRWSRGYGPGAAKLLKRIRRGEDWRQANRAVFREGSYGNGAAMRAPILGLLDQGDHLELLRSTRASAEITHAHPLGIAGAQVMAVATQCVAQGATLEQVLRVVRKLDLPHELKERLVKTQTWFAESFHPGAKALRQQLGNGVAAAESCVTALYLALLHRHAPFQKLLDEVIWLGGDVDTIAAMAGALWGTWRGFSALPEDLLDKLEDKERLLQLAGQLHAAANRG